MKFSGTQKTFTYQQINKGNINDVFPLLCPVREADWLDGWSYTLIHSKSGLIEKDCVFTTPYNEDTETVWQVTEYDNKSKTIVFVRVTPNENVVKIEIRLTEKTESETYADIQYTYTALNEEQNHFIGNLLQENFTQSMVWWEKAINHYLKTGQMLKKEA